MGQRIIEKKMVEWLDAKLAKNGAAQHAIENKDARSVFIYAVESCVGIRESGGNNRGPMVKLLQETIDSAEAESWCMSFMQTCIAYAEKKTGVKSPVLATETCTECWDKTPKGSRVKIAPLPGAIVIWQHGNAWKGHTGMVSEYRGSTMETVEGNTGGESFSDGDGVYMKIRNSKKTGSMKVLGFLKPF